MKKTPLVLDCPRSRRTHTPGLPTYTTEDMIWTRNLPMSQCHRDGGGQQTNCTGGNGSTQVQTWIKTDPSATALESAPWWSFGACEWALSTKTKQTRKGKKQNKNKKLNKLGFCSLKPKKTQHSKTYSNGHDTLKSWVAIRTNIYSLPRRAHKYGKRF